MLNDPRHRHDAIGNLSRHATIVVGFAGLIGAFVVAGSSLALARFVPGEHTVYLIRVLRGRTGREISIMLLFAGFLLLATSWWLLRRTSSRLRWLVLAAWLVPLLVAFPVISSDMYNYAEQGWGVTHGANPTIVPAGTAPGPFQLWAGYWWGTTVSYPQLGLGLSGLSVLLGGGHQYLTLLTLRVWPLLGLVILAWAVAALSPERGETASNRAWLAVANPVVLVHGINDGHSDLLAVALVVAAVAWFDDRLGRGRPRWLRWTVAILLTLLAGLIKPTALLLLAAVPWMRWGRPRSRIQRLVRLCLSGVVVGVAVGATVAVTALLPGGLRWVRATGDPGTFTDSAPRVIQTILGDALQHGHGALGVVNGAGSIVVPVSIVLTLLFIAAVVVLMDAANPWFVVLVVLTGLALLGPASRPWYFLGIAPCLALLPARDRRVTLYWLAFLLWGLLRLPTMLVNGIVVSLLPWTSIGMMVLIVHLERLAKPALRAVGEQP